ncbi:MAG: hypothetical protein KAH14_01440 [Clostridiales bacterium]|nr:hypothetical protein [Clostridiales bacterium]
MSEKRRGYLWTMVPAVLAVVMAVGVFLMDKPEDILSGDYAIVILAIATGYLIFTIYAMYTINEKTLTENTTGKGAGMVIAIIIFALITRIYIANMISGYPTDMLCWTAWSSSASGDGLFQIYSDMSFLDYPPGYIYVLHIIGSIGKLTGIECGTQAYNLLLKIPAIISDIIMGWIIYRLCSKKFMHKLGLILAFLYVMNPLVLLDSAAWGQIDSILTLAVAGYLLALYKENIIGATLIFIAGLLIKPQMLFFGPVLAVVFIQYSIKAGWGKAIKTFFISLFSGVALFALVVFPFTGDKPWYWIFEKYMGTINSYNYITLNSANIYGIFGLNWMPTETVKLGLPLGTWGLIGLITTVVIYFIAGFINRDKKNIFMLTAMLMTGVYAFGLKMHERYLFPVIAILLIVYIYDNKKSILAKFSVLTTAVFINVAQVLAVIHIPPDDLIFKVSSGVVVTVYIWIAVYCFIEAIKSHKESKTNHEETTDEIMSFSPPE